MFERRKFISGADILPPSRVVVDFSNSVDRTVQSARADADINVIVKRFGLTGQVKAANVEPFYGDFSGVDDYHAAMNLLVKAKDAFSELPADLRERFGNDPGQLVSFVNDDRNLEEARRLGLCKAPEAAPEPQLVRVVPEPPSAAPPA